MMIFSRTLLLAAMLLTPMAIAETAAASTDSQFRAAVARVLNGVRNEFLDGLSAAEKREFIACAQGVMDAVPAGRKRYVLAASGGEQRARFDEIAQDNNARLKQRVARECS
jgi:hypothetical protein